MTCVFDGTDNVAYMPLYAGHREQCHGLSYLRGGSLPGQEANRLRACHSTCQFHR